MPPLPKTPTPYFCPPPPPQVCELDIIFNFEKAYFILDEFVMGGEIQDTSKKSVLKAIEQADLLQEVGTPPARPPPPPTGGTVAPKPHRELWNPLVPHKEHGDPPLPPPVSPHGPSVGVLHPSAPPRLSDPPIFYNPSPPPLIF